jgi:hypothetical protein
MKNVFKYASLLFVAGALLVTSCSKKKDDSVTPTPDPTPTCTGGSVKSLTYDVSAANPYGTGTQENASVAVSKCDGSYNIVIKADNDDDLDFMYILKSTDGGKKEAVKLGDVKDGNGNTWTGNSSSYTLKAPGSGDKKKFTLSINIPVRSAENGTDAYEVWFTKAGALGNGRFSKPDAKRDLGPILASFNYGSIKYATTTFTAEAGSQDNLDKPSYIITTGTGGTLTLADVRAAMADSTKEFNAVNMLFYVLNDDLSLRGTTKPALVSPRERASLGYTAFTMGSTTTFDLYTSAFATAEETELKALNPTLSKIAIEAGKTYSFKTIDATSGKVSVGLVKVETITGTGSNRTANFTFKVLNVKLAANNL